MFASSDRKKFARNLLIPIIENEIGKRRYINEVSNEQMVTGLKNVLEKIADNFEGTEKKVLE